MLLVQAMPAVSLGQLQDVFAQHRQAPQVRTQAVCSVNALCLQPSL